MRQSHLMVALALLSLGTVCWLIADTLPLLQQLIAQMLWQGLDKQLLQLSSSSANISCFP